MAWTSRASAWMQNRHQLREIAASRTPYYVHPTVTAEEAKRAFDDGKTPARCLEVANQPCTAGIAQSSSSAAHRQDKGQIPSPLCSTTRGYLLEQKPKLPHVSNGISTVYSKSSSRIQHRNAFSTHQSWGNNWQCCRAQKTSEAPACACVNVGKHRRNDFRMVACM